MRRIHLAAQLAVTALGLAATTTFAQIGPTPPGGIPGRGSDGRVLDGRDVYTCTGTPGGSRIRPNCDFETKTVSHEQPLKLSFKLNEPPPTAHCSAAVTTEYQQRNSVARIESTLDITDCTLASGAFTVAISVKDESGAESPLEFSETWQRSDERDVHFAADYRIGENVELLDVRLRAFTCTCADATVEAPPSAEE